MDKTKLLFKAIVITWAAIWLLFLVRGLVKGEAEDYARLFGKSLREKQALVSGEEFYDFILFCGKIIPGGYDYRVEATYDESMDYFRFAYYMYPAVRNLDCPEYIACYKTTYSQAGYRRVAALSETKYILQKVRRDR